MPAEEPRDIAEGWIDAELRDEFPALALLEVTVDAVDGRSSRLLRERLREHSSRLYGAKAISIRSQPVPQAVRVFYRQIGLDPDAAETRTPIEQAIVDRLFDGHFRSRGAVRDALRLATVETGMPVGALDDDALDGPLGIRPAHDGDRLGEGAGGRDLAAGRLVVADAAAPVAVLFGDVATTHKVTARTGRVRLYCVGVPGVAEIHGYEALHVCAEALAEGTGRR